MTSPQSNQRSDRGSPPGRAAWLLMALLLVAGTPVHPGGAFGQDAPVDEDRPPATVPAGLGQLPLGTDVDILFEDPYPGTVPEPRPAEFDEHEWSAILKYKDGSRGHDEEGYYLLLEKVDDLKVESARDVAHQQLLADPKQFRARPVKMRLQYLDTVEGETARPKRVRKVYDSRTFIARSRNEQDVVVVVSKFPPPGMAAMSHLEVAGYFYKIENFPAKEGGGTVDVPVVIAHRITPILREGMRFDKTVAGFVLVIILGVIWLVLRVRLSRRSAGGGSSYRPRRFEMTNEDIERSRRQLDFDQPAGPAPPPDRPTDSPPREPAP